MFRIRVRSVPIQTTILKMEGKTGKKNEIGKLKKNIFQMVCEVLELHWRSVDRIYRRLTDIFLVRVAVVL